jgi:ribonucleoside-diphosphate reductase alpha chain
MQKITKEIWESKYRHGDETMEGTVDRVIDAVYANDPDMEAREQARELFHKKLIVPAGRIIAGAGTGKRVTLINCFVSPKIQDSMDTIPSEPGKGIMDCLKDAAITQQMGGGIGMGFSSVRPRGAVVKRTGSVSTGVLPFMDMWNAMCGTVKSSGSRRGAMMGTLAIWHPDILEFIIAKQEEGRLKNFNVSVLVTDEFMDCLKRDGDWDLHFTMPRADGNHVDMYTVGDGRLPGNMRYIYQRIRARELWDQVIESTYIHAEPGVIFIDRVNNLNNLQYCEHIDATNPCGEQPLPSNGDCDLGHVNLAEMVLDPFTNNALFNWPLLTKAADVMARLLDNVLDVTIFPTEEQRLEALSKRRTGLGYTGLANALQQLGIRYGSPGAIKFTREVGATIRNAAYTASVELAKERGAFPLFGRDQYCDRPFIKMLPVDIQNGIHEHGIRNGVLLSIAPTGTTSMLLGNVSSGIEPVFAHEYDRKVMQEDGSLKTTDSVYDYGALKYREVNGESNNMRLPSYFVTAKDLTVFEHLEMQAAAQEFVDASISKTINCPTEMPFEEFKEVYNLAYKMGLKGCTTYRPDPRSKRGAVLTEKSDKPGVNKEIDTKALVVNNDVVVHAKAPMQDVLEGRRYRIKWPSIEQAFYLIVNDYIDPRGVRRPFECFVNTKSVVHEQWIKGITRMISAIMRREDDIAFLVEELQQVYAPDGAGVFVNGKHVPSIVAMIGLKVEDHLKWLGLLPGYEVIDPVSLIPVIKNTQVAAVLGDVCAKCSAPAVVKFEGCRKCMNCGSSDCG